MVFYDQRRRDWIFMVHHSTILEGDGIGPPADSLTVLLLRSIGARSGSVLSPLLWKNLKEKAMEIYWNCEPCYFSDNNEGTFLMRWRVFNVCFCRPATYTGDTNLTWRNEIWYLHLIANWKELCGFLS